MSEPNTKAEVGRWALINLLRCEKEVQLSVVAKILQGFNREQIDQALSMSGVIDSGEWDSTRIIGEVRKRYDQIEKEGKCEWQGFYNGWIEGRVKMLTEIKGYKHDR